MEEKEVIEEVKPKNDLEFKVNFGKADRVRLVYIGVSFLLMFASIYKINFMGYSDSVNVIDYAFSGLNFGTLYFIVLVLAIAVEVVVNLQDNDFVKKNKETLGLAVPVSLFILTLIFIYIGFDLRSQVMGTGSISIFLFIGLLIHGLYFTHIKFPEMFNDVIKQVKNIKK